MSKLLTISLFLIFCLCGCATAPAPSPEPVANSEDAVNNYRLDQGDIISIQVFDEPDLTMESQIGANGVISYSYLGDIQVRGKSSTQIEDELTNLFKNGYLVNPSVNVTVVKYRSFYINGEVNTPGSYQFEPGLTIDRAITIAGGLTDRASKRKITVTRLDQNGKSVRSQAAFSDEVQPLDTINVDEGFF